MNKSGYLKVLFSWSLFDLAVNKRVILQSLLPKVKLNKSNKADKFLGMAVPCSFRALVKLSLLLTLSSSFNRPASGEVDIPPASDGNSGRCFPLPDPALVNRFLLTNHSDLRNPAFRESINGFDASGGFRFPRALQLVKCHSLGNASFDFYQVESSSKRVCEAPPPLDFDVSRDVRGKLKGPGGLLFFAFLVAAIITALSTLFGVFNFAELVVRTIGRLARWLREKLCASPPVYPSAESASDIEEEASHRATFELVKDVWVLDKSASQATLSGGSGSSTVSATLPPYPSWPPIPQIITREETPKRTSALQKTWAFAKGLASCVYAILLFGSLFGLEGLIIFLMLCQSEVNEVTSKGPIGLPDPAGGLNQFLSDSGTGLNLMLCTTGIISFYVSCPDVQNCSGLGEPYGADRVPMKEPLRVCPDYFGRSLVKMDTIQYLCFGMAVVIVVAPRFWYRQCCLTAEGRKWARLEDKRRRGQTVVPV